MICWRSSPGSKPRRSRCRVLAMSGAQPLDTGTAIGRLMLAVIGAVGQAEREAMLERQREGIAKAKRRAAIRAVCRPLGARLTRSSGSRRQASGPRKSPAGWGLARASVYRVLGTQAKDQRGRCANPRLGAQHRQHGRNCNASP